MNINLHTDMLAFVKANSMGASIADLSQELLILWGQCIGYFIIACLVYRERLNNSTKIIQ